jgi:hypothetical protein
MEEKQKLICDRCKVEMAEFEAEFSYLNRSFRTRFRAALNADRCISPKSWGRPHQRRREAVGRKVAAEV